MAQSDGDGLFERKNKRKNELNRLKNEQKKRTIKVNTLKNKKQSHPENRDSNPGRKGHGVEDPDSFELGRTRDRLVLPGEAREGLS